MPRGRPCKYGSRSSNGKCPPNPNTTRRSGVRGRPCKYGSRLSNGKCPPKNKTVSLPKNKTRSVSPEKNVKLIIHVYDKSGKSMDLDMFGRDEQEDMENSLSYFMNDKTIWFRDAYKTKKDYDDGNNKNIIIVENVSKEDLQKIKLNEMITSRFGDDKVEFKFKTSILDKGEYYKIE